MKSGGAMKYAVIIPDGAADEPLEALGGRTALEAAEIPAMDGIAMEGRQGMVRTVPKEMEPGSDVAQLSLLGYDPRRFYSGRAPIEAAAKRIPLGPEDWVFRCNLVTYADAKMADHSAGHITTEEADVLIKELARRLGSESLQFHTGVSYRHLLVCKSADFKVKTFPPHDNIGRPVEEILPMGAGAELLRELMAKSAELFEGHPLNKDRLGRGKSPVSSIWLWGQGRQLALEAFHERFGLKGAAITAVDLIRGLAALVGFDVIEVPGATGFYDTNYEGKAAAAIKALKDYDLAFIHVEAPDEASHAGDADIKKKSLERIDRLVVAPVLRALRAYPKWRILVLPDHPTLVRTRGHSHGFVPFAMAGTGIDASGKGSFSEAAAGKTGLRIENGHELMRYFLEG